MLTRARLTLLPSFPLLPPPFDLFKVDRGMALQAVAEFLYHRRRAPRNLTRNWVHHHRSHALRSNSVPLPRHLHCKRQECRSRGQHHRLRAGLATMAPLFDRGRMSSKPITHLALADSLSESQPDVMLASAPGDLPSSPCLVPLLNCIAAA